MQRNLNRSAAPRKVAGKARLQSYANRMRPIRDPSQGEGGAKPALHQCASQFRCLLQRWRAELALHQRESHPAVSCGRWRAKPGHIHVHISQSVAPERDLGFIRREVHRKQFHPSRGSKKNKGDPLARYKAVCRFHSVKFAMAAISSCDWTGLERCI